METLINIIDAMMTRTFCATMNGQLTMFRVLFFAFMFALMVSAVSVVRLCIQLIIKKTRK